MIDSDARKILAQWARAGYYVYLRPLCLPSQHKGKPFWRVTVEVSDSNVIIEEGKSLNKTIQKVEQRTPRRIRKKVKS